MITAIIVNWKRPLDTIACVQSLRETSYEDMQILVVDNGSDDNSVKQIQTSCPFVTIIQLPENKGYTGGFNAGIDHALQTNTTHILVLNNDTIVGPNAIEALAYTSWDVAIPKILFHAHPNIIWAAGAEKRRFPPSIIMVGYKKLDGLLYDQPKPLTYATGCALLVKRSVFENIGGFDPDFGSYMEDYDFFYRTKQAGFATGYVPTSHIYHKVSLTLGENSKQKQWYLGRNTVLFYRKQQRFPIRLLWSTIIWVSIRETLKLNFIRLFDYWRGVRAGHRFLQKTT